MIPSFTDVRLEVGDDIVVFEDLRLSDDLEDLRARERDADTNG